MTKTRALALLASAALILTVFVVLPGVGADEKTNSSKDALYRPLGLFTEVLSLVRSNYVEPVELKPLLSGAFAGLTDAMDPFAEYIPPDRVANFNALRAAEEKGDVLDIGIVLARRFSYPVVVAATSGSPAAASGVKSDDIIEEIDGQPARSMAIWEVESKLAGKAGGRVRLTVVREGKPRRRTIDIVRSSWVPSAPFAVRAEGETIITISAFVPGTAAELKKILAPLDRTRPLLLDVRNNGIGSYDEAARCAALFVPAGPLGELRGRRIAAKSFRAEPGERVHAGHLVVLVDSGTAGPAEFFAAAVREASGARQTAIASKEAEEDSSETGEEEEVPPTPSATPVRLVGEPTGGMGFMQRVIPLASGGSLKLSVGKFYGPAGRALSPKGLNPDDRVYQLPPEETPGRPETDPFLKRGLKVLAELHGPLAA